MSWGAAVWVGLVLRQGLSDMATAAFCGSASGRAPSYTNRRSLTTWLCAFAVIGDNRDGVQD